MLMQACSVRRWALAIAIFLVLGLLWPHREVVNPLPVDSHKYHDSHMDVYEYRTRLGSYMAGLRDLREWRAGDAGMFAVSLVTLFTFAPAIAGLFGIAICVRGRGRHQAPSAMLSIGTGAILLVMELLAWTVGFSALTAHYAKVERWDQFTSAPLFLLIWVIWALYMFGWVSVFVGYALLGRDPGIAWRRLVVWGCLSLLVSVLLPVYGGPNLFHHLSNLPGLVVYPYLLGWLSFGSVVGVALAAILMGWSTLRGVRLSRPWARLGVFSLAAGAVMLQYSLAFYGGDRGKNVGIINAGLTCVGRLLEWDMLVLLLSVALVGLAIRSHGSTVIQPNGSPDPSTAIHPGRHSWEKRALRVFSCVFLAMALVAGIAMYRLSKDPDFIVLHGGSGGSRQSSRGVEQGLALFGPDGERIAADLRQDREERERSGDTLLTWTVFSGLLGLALLGASFLVPSSLKEPMPQQQNGAE
jgi:hypothetical protein